MNAVIEFIKGNWQLILSICLFVLSFILQLIKKKPVKVVDGVRKFVLEKLPSIINLAESAFGSKEGKLKFDFVYETICQLVADSFGVQACMVSSVYDNFISSSIEEILSTPQKHEIL